jgi:hypothetical protein
LKKGGAFKLSSHFTSYNITFYGEEGMLRKGKAVVVTTEHRGVFFGYFEKITGDTVVLKKVRNCIYWPTSVKGFIGLATSGPLNGSRVGPPADEATLYKVTAILKASKEAVKNWEKAPWR